MHTQLHDLPEEVAAFGAHQRSLAGRITILIAHQHSARNEARFGKSVKQSELMIERTRQPEIVVVEKSHEFRATHE